jgi:alkylated DNA repair dioxygenase AlkB
LKQSLAHPLRRKNIPKDFDSGEQHQDDSLAQQRPSIAALHKWEAMKPYSQADLFDVQGLLSIDVSFATARRTALDAHSWVEVVPCWMTGSSALFTALETLVPWKQHHRQLFQQTFLEPRLTAEYRSMGNVPHQALLDAAAALTEHYGVAYDSLWLNLYRDGRDSTGWHRDRFSCRRPQCVVPVLTLGVKRQFLLKPRGGGPSMGFTPAAGDLIVMGGRCQEDWVHGVPKCPGILEPRISVNFQSSVQARRLPDEAR